MNFQSLDGWERTRLSNEVSEKDLEQEICLMGWIMRRRDHGGVIFVDLRDRSGLVQLVFNPEFAPETHLQAHILRPEWVVAVNGIVRKRPEDSFNTDIPTGTLEVFVSKMKILNSSDSLPFTIDEDDPPTDLVRYRYRYLDLRRLSGARNQPAGQAPLYVHYQGVLEQRGFCGHRNPFSNHQHS